MPQRLLKKVNNEKRIYLLFDWELTMLEKYGKLPINWRVKSTLNVKFVFCWRNLIHDRIHLILFHICNPTLLWGIFHFFCQVIFRRKKYSQQVVFIHIILSSFDPELYNTYLWLSLSMQRILADIGNYVKTKQKHKQIRLGTAIRYGSSRVWGAESSRTAKTSIHSIWRCEKFRRKYLNVVHFSNMINGGTLLNRLHRILILIWRYWLKCRWF